MVRIRVHTPRIIGAVRRAQYLEITIKGLKFVEKWYTTKHIPSNLTRLYQLLLKLIWMKGTITTSYAQRLGYNNNVLKLAISRDYVETHKKSIKPPVTIQNKIHEMIGEAPGWFYA